MTCRFIELAPGSHLVICSRGVHVRRCRTCGAPSTKLCDFPLRGEKAGQTCDVPLCDRCAVSQGVNRDYCPPHARLVEKEKKK